MKIVHIGPDSQFIQFLSRVFEEHAPGANIYLITGSSPAGDFRFPAYGDATSIRIRGRAGLASIPLHVRSADMVVVHGMGIHGAIAFNFSPRNVVKVWSGWGFDYYGNQNDPYADQLKSTTLSMVKELRLNERSSAIEKGLIKKIAASLIESAANKTDYFSAPIPSDFYVFRRRFIKFSGEYSQLNYGDVSEAFSVGPRMGCGKNILVGNSASAPNNHLEVFDILSKHDLGGRKIIVPLSYGDSRYRERVIASGRSIFGGAFQPLVDFLPLEKYSSILASCNVVIMNHLRQQALGNIGTAIFNGAHVFLDPSNPVYEFFKDKNAMVHSTEDLKVRPLPVSNLPDSSLTMNRAVLESFWGKEQVRANVERLINKVRERRGSK